jgi:putative intracellular protease/amidase
MADNRRSMDIAIPIFDRLTALDAVGPYEVLSRVPGATVTFVAERRGEHRDELGTLALVADAKLSDLPAPDVVVVPGGFGTRSLLGGGPLLDWVRAAHATSRWTTSVCTGSLVLAAAGVLAGLEATTHWAAMDLLRRLGAVPVERRVVEQGKVITAAGVSAGIDMALTLAARLAGDKVAQAIQLGIEYDPQPPFTSGSLRTAPPEVVELVRKAEAAQK